MTHKYRKKSVINGIQFKFDWIFNKKCDTFTWWIRQFFSYYCSLHVLMGALWICRFCSQDRCIGILCVGGSSIPTWYCIQTVCYVKCSSKRPCNSNSAICYSWSVNYTVIHSCKCQLTVKTATWRERQGKLKIWFLQLLPGFKLWDVRELICLQGFSDVRALIKYISARSWKCLQRNMVISVLPSFYLIWRKTKPLCSVRIKNVSESRVIIGSNP